MEQKQIRDVVLLVLGMGVIYFIFIKPKEARAEEVPPEEVPTEVKPSALPPGWYITEIVPLKGELAWLKEELSRLRQEFA